jgi:pilus assembly protein CpaC
MIAGLMQNSHDNLIDQTPGLGNLPVLGALFRSNGFKRNETELVIVITPLSGEAGRRESDRAADRRL